VPLPWWERQRAGDGLRALAAMAEAMTPATAAPDGRFGWMQAYNVALCS
jgi:hypothetical protein